MARPSQRVDRNRQLAGAERPYNWKKAEKPRRGASGTRIGLLIIAGVLVVLIAFVVYVQYELHTPQNGSATPFVFDVRPGDTEGSIADRLQKQGVLHNTLLFRLDARLQGLGAKLRAGGHVLRPDMSIDEMVTALGGTKVLFDAITMPAGWRAEQIAARLDANGISGRQFLQVVHHPRLSLERSAGIPPQRSLEGFLFPDTYFVTRGTSAVTMAARMVARFGQVFDASLRIGAHRQHRSIRDIVILGSIVEREARVPSERPLIASVYYNRLRIGMPLQADPTVQYGLGRPGRWWPLLSVSDYHSVHSPYNTYLHRGLPPGPIANPGLGSLLAAAYPAHTDYYYFSCRPSSGRCFFARTLQQQERNIGRYG